MGFMLCTALRKQQIEKSSMENERGECKRLHVKQEIEKQCHLLALQEIFKPHITGYEITTYRVAMVKLN